ncbi:MAG TPA: ATP-dependent DNA helicase RecG [Patescibacteria group bacterium]|nr:ATP-dependent DNA helicase RecG [Patescibacteria group bacterium]
MSSPIPSSARSALDRSVTSLPGVGPERGALLAKLDIRTTEDLLLYRPSRHEDRKTLVKISELELRQPAITHGRIVALGTKWFRQHSKSIFEIVLEDGTGRLHCRWWNLPFMEKYFAKGNDVLVFGKPIGLKPRTIDHPETEVLEGDEENFIHLNRITPIYRLTEGLGQRLLRSLIWRTLQSIQSELADPWSSELWAKSFPGIELPSRAQAIRHIHFPDRPEQIEPARKRLALDEFVELQRQIQTRRRNFEAKAMAFACGGDNRFIKPFLRRLGFKLTESQARVLREVRADMCARHPMRRLLQGDVGSGKTLVAACSALMVLESGHEVALMAPTEILAEQHFATFTKWFAPLGIEVVLRTGSSKAPAPRQRLPSANQDAALKITIGTHALIASGFQPDKLGLAIVDEQHKFGVAQREQLLRKGHYPHLLVLTATPIPRTLGLTMYGDLDISIIDELPPGRGSIRTFVRSKTQLPKVWDFIRSKLAEGRQAYIVYPHVEDSSNGIKAVASEFQNLQRAFEPFKTGMVHGRLPSRERDALMQDFRKGNVQVLLATSVIEVGVDVANATIMLIENAELFGLAQLHQLRGRIGRGSHESYCILLTGAKTKASQQRLRVMEETNDGFRIGEADLKLRGPGELLGHEQSGAPQFRFGDLANDLELIQQAKKIARELVRKNNDSGSLDKPEELAVSGSADAGSACLKKP